MKLSSTQGQLSAGGHQAVAGLVEKLAHTRPDLSVTIVKDERPYFRYGSGQWGQALFKLKLHFGKDLVIQIYSLPSPGVPVLVGMREMQQLQMVLNVRNGHAILMGQNRIFRMTSKNQILLNFSTDIPHFEACNPTFKSTTTTPSSQSILKPGSNSFTTGPPKKTGPSRHASFLQSASVSQQDSMMLEFFDEPNTLFVAQESQDFNSSCAARPNSFSHLQISEDQMRFLFGAQESGSRSQVTDSQPATSHSRDVGGQRHESQRDDSGSSQGSLEGKRNSGGHSQEQGQELQGCSAPGCDSRHGTTSSRSTMQSGSMALLQPACSVDLKQQIRRVDRLSKVRGAPQVHSPQGYVRAIYEDGSPSQCGGNPGASSDGRSQGRGHGPLPGEENSQTHRCPGSLESYQEDHSEVQGISTKREAAQAGDSAREHPDPLRRRGGNSVLNCGGIHSHREEEVQELNYGLKAPEPQILEGPTYESEEPEHEEHHDPTPKEVLSRLCESLKDSVFI